MKKILITIFILAVSSTIFAFGQKENSDNSITKVGTVVFVGNEPHKYLVLRADNNETYEIIGELVNELNRYQNLEVEVSGTLIGNRQIDVSEFTSEEEPQKLPPTR